MNVVRGLTVQLGLYCNTLLLFSVSVSVLLTDFLFFLMFDFIINVQNKPWVHLDISVIDMQKDCQMKNFALISGEDTGTIHQQIW